MSSSSAGRLKHALRAVLPPRDTAALRMLSERAGVTSRRISRALAGAPINVDDHLRLCATIGIDPVDGHAVKARAIPSFDWNLLAIKLLLAILARDSMRALARDWDIPLATLSRVKHQQTVSIDSLLAVCAALGCHPHMFLARTRMFHDEHSGGTPVATTDAKDSADLGVAP